MKILTSVLKADLDRGGNIKTGVESLEDKRPLLCSIGKQN